MDGRGRDSPIVGTCPVFVRPIAVYAEENDQHDGANDGDEDDQIPPAAAPGVMQAPHRDCEPRDEESQGDDDRQRGSNPDGRVDS